MPEETSCIGHRQSWKEMYSTLTALIQRTSPAQIGETTALLSHQTCSNINAILETRLTHRQLCPQCPW